MDETKQRVEQLEKATTELLAIVRALRHAMTRLQRVAYDNTSRTDAIEAILQHNGPQRPGDN